MKRKVLSLLLILALCFTLSASAFAEETTYKNGQDVELFGWTDFEYYYTYTAGEKNYKCFSVVADGQHFYAAIRESLYEYCRSVFADQELTFKGSYQMNAEDGVPIILIRQKLVSNEEGQSETSSIAECLLPVLSESSSSLDFQVLYDLYDGGTVSIAEDGSYITVDTNPFNFKDSFLFKSTAIAQIKQIHKIFGLPDWLYEEMASTRALDGRQKEYFDNLTVTWSYHPNQGLEVIYRKNA